MKPNWDEMAVNIIDVAEARAFVRVDLPEGLEMLTESFDEAQGEISSGNAEEAYILIKVVRSHRKP